MGQSLTKVASLLKSNQLYLLNCMLINLISFTIAAEECKKKWKTLRIQQRRIIIKKIKKNEKRSAIQWNCYDALKFLIQHMDWTATDDIKKDSELDLSILSDICDDEGNDEVDDEPEVCDASYENEENCESQSESSYGSSQMYNNTASARPVPADPLNVPRSAMDAPHLCTTTAFSTGLTDSKMNHQYLVAYLPTVASTAQTNPLQIRNEADLIAANAANCVAMNSTSNAPATIFAAPGSAAESTSTAATPLDSTKYSSINNQRIVTVPVASGPTIVNYFLMDLAVQMERLNDIAQIELKIEINRLLLEKLKNVNNLRQAQTSICFTTPQNPN